MQLSHCGYQIKVYRSVEIYSRTIHEMVQAVRAFNREEKVDAIAFRGMSGAAIAFPVCAELRIPPVLVRKDEERRHSSFQVEGPQLDIQRYVIIDDLIASGETIAMIKRRMGDAKCMHIFLYESSRTTEHDRVGVTVVGCS